MPTETEPAPQAAPRRKGRRWKLRLLSLPFVLLLLMFVCARIFSNGYGPASTIYHWFYRRNVACLKQLGIYLALYAQRYEGAYPAGAGSAEASLSILWHEFQVPTQYLAGKAVPGPDAEAVLQMKRYLDSEHCSFVYVEGLTKNDNPCLAVAWEKFPGYAHHGQRTFDDRREVLLVDGSTHEFQTEAEW